MYPEQTTQDHLFADLSGLIQSSLDGHNVCIFSYGQTGAGKTYTMLGGEGEEKGLLPRTIQMLFNRAKELEQFNYQISFQICFSEIYNDKMHDLLTGKDIPTNINETCLSRLLFTSAYIEHSGDGREDRCRKTQEIHSQN